MRGIKSAGKRFVLLSRKNQLGKHTKISPDDARRLEELIGGAGKGVLWTLDSIRTKVEELLKSKIVFITAKYPDAKIGYRGSLATGKKYKTGGPFDPNDFDVDAFIVSDKLADRFVKKVKWRDARDEGFEQLANELEFHFKETFKGYRVDPKKPFTFRVWTENEYINKIKQKGARLIQ